MSKGGAAVDDDIKLTPLQRAYLLAFDNWLYTTWKTNPGQVDNPATGLKDACFDELMREDGRVLICLRCGTEPVLQHGEGRPRKYCLTCSPRARPGAHRGDPLPEPLALAA